MTDGQEQETKNGHDNQGFQGSKDARKSFRKAIKGSQWQTFKDKHYHDPTFRKKDIINHLNSKAKRSQTMGAKALEQVWSRDGVDTNGDFRDKVQRSRSSNSEFGKKVLSSNAHLIKVKVQISICQYLIVNG